MIKNKYILLAILSLFCIGIFTGCSDDDIENEPQKIDLNSITLTPLPGGITVEWTPPADKNFVFLHVKLIDQENKERSFSSSRYFDENNVNTTKTIQIDKLINKQYTLDFYAYNNDNNSIYLGSKEITPLDNSELEPAIVTDVIIDTDRSCVILKWAEPKVHSYSTYEGVRFTFVNTLTNTVTKVEEYDVIGKGLNLRLDTVEIDPGNYRVDIESYSAKNITKAYTRSFSIEVLEFYRLDRTGWTVSDVSSEEPTGEGVGNGVVSCILDGNLSTFWHTKWAGGSLPLPHSFVIDMKKEYEVTQVGMHQRNLSSNKDTKAGEIYISNNKADWVKIGDFALEKVEGYQNTSVTHTTGRYLKIIVTESYRAANASLAELLVYANDR